MSNNPLTWYNELTAASTNTTKDLDVSDPYLKSLAADRDNRSMLTEEERRKVRRKNREDLKKLNLAWLNEMVNSENQMNEKMSLFWHGHFACRNQNILYQTALNQFNNKTGTWPFGRSPPRSK